MKLPATLGLSAIIAAQSAAAGWTFTWRQPNGTPHVVTALEDKGCTVIDHGKGKEFDWTRSFESDCCIRLWTNPHCSGDMAGFSCPSWKKDASVTLFSFEVTNCILP